MIVILSGVFCGIYQKSFQPFPSPFSLKYLNRDELSIPPSLPPQVNSGALLLPFFLQIGHPAVHYFPVLFFFYFAHVQAPTVHR